MSDKSQGIFVSPVHSWKWESLREGPPFGHRGIKKISLNLHDVYRYDAFDVKYFHWSLLENGIPEIIYYDSTVRILYTFNWYELAMNVGGSDLNAKLIIEEIQKKN